MRIAESLRFWIVFIIGFVGLTLGVTAGLLMSISPKMHANFWRQWYARLGRPEVDFLASCREVETRVAGILIAIVSVFFLWILAGKVFTR